MAQVRQPVIPIWLEGQMIPHKERHEDISINKFEGCTDVASHVICIAKNLICANIIQILLEVMVVPALLVVTNDKECFVGRLEIERLHVNISHLSHMALVLLLTSLMVSEYSYCRYASW